MLRLEQPKHKNCIKERAGNAENAKDEEKIQERGLSFINLANSQKLRRCKFTKFPWKNYASTILVIPALTQTVTVSRDRCKEFQKNHRQTSKKKNYVVKRRNRICRCNKTIKKRLFLPLK